MKISLVYPVYCGPKGGLTFDQLHSGAQEILQFFKKFPIETEFVFVVDNHWDQKTTEQELENLPLFKTDSFKLKINSAHLGRGPSVQAGLDMATGEYLLIASIDLNIPLAEYFSFIQQLISQSEIDLLIGNRLTTKRPKQGRKRKWHQVLEDILTEKYQSHFGVKDPICHFIAIRKDLWSQANKQVSFKSWYYSLDLLKWCKDHQKNITESPIQSRDNEKSLIPLKTEFLKSLLKN